MQKIFPVWTFSACNNFLKQIQKLFWLDPPTLEFTLLLGKLHITALLHKNNNLLTFGIIARSDSVENDLAIRQLTKGKKKHIFFRVDIGL